MTVLRVCVDIPEVAVVPLSERLAVLVDVVSVVYVVGEPSERVPVTTSVLVTTDWETDEDEDDDVVLAGGGAVVVEDVVVDWEVVDCGWA
jgi:hypothetical protein